MRDAQTGAKSAVVAAPSVAAVAPSSSVDVDVDVAAAAASVVARSRRQRCTSHAEEQGGPSGGAVSRAGAEISISAATGRWSEIERSSQLEYEMTRSAAWRGGRRRVGD